MSSSAGAGTLRSAESSRVEPVRGWRDMRAFLRLPFAIYAEDPVWVAPLLMEQRKLLDRSSHPFHEHAEVEYFLARRAGRVVGRIAAIVNHRHNDFHEERTGFFGFFESVEDPEVAASLLGRVESWLRERGMERARGPMNFSTNEECGLLVDGFEAPPTVMMTHHRPYYAGLLERTGYEKARDLFAYWVEDFQPSERLLRGASRIASRAGVTVRPMELRRFRDEVEAVKEIYHSAWERNWGFVPMTDRELARMAADLKKIVDPRLCLFAEVDGKPVGFLLALPDLNQALRHLDGRLLPFGIFKLLWYSRRIDQIRVITMGIRPGYRRLGLDALLNMKTYELGTAAGYRRAECSWILEENWDMRRALERLGARVYKTYRIYEKVL